MDYKRDLNNSRNNQMYYHQFQKYDAARKKKKKKSSFASKKVEVKELVWAPEGYEGTFIFLYFVSVPYITGAIFLFLGIAQADYSSFMKLNTTAFFIVWAIGYEIVATVSLIYIFILFLKHDDS